MMIKSKNGLIVVVDVGSSKITGIACRYQKQGGENVVTILGTSFHKSRGIKQGYITDITLAKEALQHVLSDLETQIHERIEGVVIGLPASILQSHHFRLRASIPHGQVRLDDMRRLLSQCQQILGQNSKEQVIHSIPLSYQIADTDEIDNPLHMFGSPLTARAHCIAAITEKLMTLVHCLGLCQVNVHGFVAGGYAAGMATLTEDERYQGVTLFDIGAHTVAITQWRQGKCSHLGYVPIGGGHITADIAQGLSLSLEQAEQMKTVYGNATVIARDIHQILDLPFLQEESALTPRLPVTQAMLGEIIHPRVEEIAEMALRSLKKSPQEQTTLSRLVITGGGSNLLGIAQVLESVLKTHTIRLGTPNTEGWLFEQSEASNALSLPIYAVAVGLLKFTLYQLVESSYDGGTYETAHSPWERAKQWVRGHLTS